MGVGRVGAFCQQLPARGLNAAQVAEWRAAVEAFELSLGAGMGRPFGKYEINRYLQQRRVGGADDQVVAFLTATLADYDTWCSKQPQGAGPSQPKPVVAPQAIRRVAMTEEDHAALRRRKLQVAIALGGVVVIAGGCVAEHFRTASRIRAFSSAVRAEARRVAGPAEAEDLKLRVLALAQQHSVKVGPDDVVTFIGELTPHRMAMLPQNERMEVMEVMQQNAQRAMAATRQERSRMREAGPMWYVEVDLRGKVPGLLGGTAFDFQNHVVVGEDLRHEQ